MLDKNVNLIRDDKPIFNFDDYKASEVTSELLQIRFTNQRVQFSVDDFKSIPQILTFSSEKLEYIKMFFTGFLYMYSNDDFIERLNYRIRIFENDNLYCGEIQYLTK